jgi:hypothetical protein
MVERLRAMSNKVSIQMVLLGTQLHIYAIEKLSKYKSELFFIHSTTSIAILPNTDLPDWSYSKSLLASLYEPSDETDITIGIIENKIEGNYFARRLGDKNGILTFYQAEEILQGANIDLFNYLLLSIYKMITLYQLSDKRINENSADFIHDETRGCLFDMMGNKHDLIHSAANACLCQQCEATLAKQKLPAHFIATLKKELKKIRKSRYNKIVEFVKRRPILSITITAISSIILNIIASCLYEMLFK